jgi:hypothetical protein
MIFSIVSWNKDTSNNLSSPKKETNIIILWLFFLLIISEVLATPILSFNSPTKPDGAILFDDFVDVNVSINEEYLDSFQFDWGGLEYNFYDKSLVLALNFNNNSLIGDDSSTITDISSYSNHGWIYGPKWTNHGRFGSGIQFDGLDDYLNFGNDKSLNAESITIEFWFYLASNPDCDTKNNWRTLLSKGAPLATSTGYDIVLEENGQIKWDTGNGSSDRLYVPERIPIRQWVHLSATYDASTGTKNFYYNGLLKATKRVNAGVIKSNSYNLTLSRPSQGCSDGFGGINGTIDELRIYNRSLSADEIWIHYNSELQKVNPNSWGFYVTLLGIMNGINSFSASAKDDFGSIGETEVRRLTLPCVVPYSGMSVYSNTTLCSGAII